MALPLVIGYVPVLSEDTVSETLNALRLVPFVATMTGVVAILVAYALCRFAEFTVSLYFHVKEPEADVSDFLHDVNRKAPRKNAGNNKRIIFFDIVVD